MEVSNHVSDQAISTVDNVDVRNHKKALDSQSGIHGGSGINGGPSFVSSPPIMAAPTLLIKDRQLPENHL